VASSRLIEQRRNAVRRPTGGDPGVQSSRRAGSGELREMSPARMELSSNCGHWLNRCKPRSKLSRRWMASTPGRDLPADAMHAVEWRAPGRIALNEARHPLCRR
jgi:hypothetical protein